MNKAEMNLNEAASFANEAMPSPQNMGEAIQLLRAKNLGRSLAFIDTNSKTGIPKEEFGYVLPVNLKQTEHIILFDTGDILLVAPEDAKPETFVDYLKIFSPSPTPFVFAVETFRDINVVVNELSFHMKTLESKCVLRNNSSENLSILQTKIDSALMASAELQRNSAKAKDQSIDYLLGRLGNTIPAQIESPEEENDDRYLDF